MGRPGRLTRTLGLRCERRPKTLHRCDRPMVDLVLLAPRTGAAAHSLSVLRRQTASRIQCTEGASIHAKPGLRWTCRDIDWTFLDKSA
jgi:hypothetical protein